MSTLPYLGFSSKLLAGKVGIVTGAGSPRGIGRSIVIALAQAGARAVYATDLSLTNIPSLQKIVKDAGLPCDIHGAILDVTSEEQTIDVLKQILSTYGRLDMYFANAGFGTFRKLQETSLKDYNRAVAVMQESVFMAIRYGGQAMSATSPEKESPGGSIIVTSSMAGVMGGVSDISYSSVKAAANGILKSASVQLSATHVRINSIAPGFIKTSIGATSQQTAEGKIYEGQNEKEAVGVFADVLDRMLPKSGYYYDRIMEPEEMANIGVFLASDLSAAINAQVIVADSGKTAAAFGEAINGPIDRLTPL